MRNRFIQFFTPPSFEGDEEKTFLAQLTFYVILAAYVIFILGLPVAYLTTTEGQNILLKYALLFGGLVLNTASLVFVKRGLTNAANLLLLGMSTTIVYVLAFISGGLERPAIFLNIFILALSGALFRNRGLIFTGIILALGVVIVYGLETAFPNPQSNLPAPRESVMILNIFIIILTGLMLQVSNRFLDNTLQRARESEQQLLAANRELESTGNNLQALVAERTIALENQLQQLEKHTAQLQAITDISQALVSIQAFDQALPTLVNSISERFGYYHAAIYLKDEPGEFLVLKAASSEGGKRLLEQQHKLRVEPSSLVGFAGSRGLARVVADVERDATYLATAELRETRSEVVLPLQAGTQIMGVLDVQSTQPNAFQEREVNILNTLANQLAISAQNDRLFSETRQALVESEKIYQQYVAQNWKQISRKTLNLGYQYLPTGETEQLETPIEAPQTGAEQPAMLIPIQLRGQTIGMLSVENRGQEWDQDELAIIQATAERVALALESARLLEDSQRRATKERIVSDIAAKITGSVSMENILKTAATELGQVLPKAEVVIQFQGAEAEPEKNLQG